MRDALKVLQQGKYSEYYHGHDGSVYTTNFNGLRIGGLNGRIGRSDFEIGLSDGFIRTIWEAKLNHNDGLFNRYTAAISCGNCKDSMPPPFIETEYLDAEASHDQASAAGRTTKAGDMRDELEKYYTAETRIEESSVEGEPLIQRQTTALRATETCSMRHFLSKLVLFFLISMT